MKAHQCAVLTASIAATLASCSTNEHLVLPKREPSFRPDPGFFVFTDTDLDGDNGSVEVTRNGPRFGLSDDLTQDSTWDFEAQVESSDYEFSGLPAAVSNDGTLAEDALMVRLRGGVEFPIDRRSAIEVGGLLTVGAEDGADLDDALMAGGYARYSHRVNADYTFRMGVSVQSLLEDDQPLVLPVLGHHWQIHRRLWLDLTDDSQGIGGRLNWRPQQDRNLFLDVRYQRRDFRLDDNGLLPAAVLRDERGIVSLGASWTPVDSVEVFGLIGFTPWGQIEIDDRNGTERFDEDIDPGLVFGFGGRFRL